MPARSAIFHTAKVGYRVPGPTIKLAAVAYNLQYARPLVEALLDTNKPDDTRSQLIRVGDRELTLTTVFGAHPYKPEQRVCAIGIGDAEDRASVASDRAWFNFHASALFGDVLERHTRHTEEVHRRVPGLPVKGAETVGVAYELDYLSTAVDSALARNQPTGDEMYVVTAPEFTLMRADIVGGHPLDPSRQIRVGGIADRHYRAVAAAEQAWRNFHTTLLFAATALSAD
jgi:hypothetical protein